MNVLAKELAEVADNRRLPPPQFRRLIREQAGLSQAAMARAVGVGRSTMTRWEAGTRTPRGKVLREYLSVLNKLLEATR